MTGKIKPLTPTEWMKQKGRACGVSRAEAEAALRLEADGELGAGAAFMSQWTFEEEMRTSQPAATGETLQTGGWFRVRFALKLLAFAFGPGALIVWFLRAIPDRVRSLLYGA